jgi:phosphate transport system protein
MARDLTQGHTVRSFDHDLAALRTLAVDMGERVIEQVQSAVSAVIKEDRNQAYLVLDRKTKLEHLSLDADEEVFRVIAMRQPIAVDLRAVLALSRVIGEFGRAGDKAVLIANQSLVLVGDEKPCQLPDDLRAATQALNTIVCCLLERAVEALSTFDSTRAQQVLSDAKDLHLARTELDEALGLDQSPGLTIETPTHVAALLLMAHTLEHIGMHAANVAEQVIYVAEGKDVRFRNREILIDSLRHQSSFEAETTSG